MSITVRRASGVPANPTPTLLAFPAWTANPYLNVLHLASRAAGWEILGEVGLDGLSDAVDNTLVGGDIVHVHWTSPVTEDAQDEDTATGRLHDFRKLLTRITQRRIRLIWTVHNEIAHDTRYPDIERKVAGALAESASLIIQLHEHTAEAVAGSYQLPPEKLVTLRHSSYVGLYPDTTRQLARERLGLPPDAPTVGFFGRIRPYKGIGTLLAAIELAASRVDGLQLVLAGRTSPDDLAEIEQNLPRNVDVVQQHTFVCDREVALWLRAANVIAFPYKRILNSGSLLLAASFDRPCIIPADGPLAKLYRDEPWVYTYDVKDDAVSSLADVLVRTARGDRKAECLAHEFAQSYTPYDMSRDYLRIIESLTTVSVEEELA